MADRVLPGPVDGNACISEAVCIHTSKIFDSCRDKDCVEDLRVYPTRSSQTYIDSAFSIRPRAAELLYVDVNVEEITFNRGYYTVDVTYFYKVTGESFPGGNVVTGLAVFDKRVILFGSEGSAKVFSSNSTAKNCVHANLNQPVAYVEAVNPIALNMKIVDASCSCSCDQELREVPPAIVAAIGEDLILTDTNRRLYVTLGQFSIIRLEREAHLVIPAYNYCIPDKECVGSCEDDPCTLFSKIRFPMEEFFPPDSVCDCENYQDMV
jgi:hypothetical protein